MKTLFCCSIIILFQANIFASEAGVTNTEIIVGAHTSESGAYAVYGVNPRAISAYFDKVNAEGGIYGRKIKFLRIDTQGVQVKSVQAAKKLVEEDKIFAMVGGMGASHQVVYKYLAEKGIPDFFFSDGLEEYGKPFNKFIFPGIGSWKDDAAALAEIAVEKLKGKKACFLVTDSTLGEEAYASIKSTLEKSNEKLSSKDKISIGTIEKTERLAVSSNAAVNILKRDGCEIVFNIIWGPLAAGAINYAVLQGFKPTWLTLGQNAFAKFLELLPDANRSGIYSITPLALDKDSQAPGWSAFEELMKKNDIPVSKIAATGYTVAELFTESVKRAGKNLTRDSVIKAAESLSNFNCSLCLKPLSLSPTDHWAFRNPTKLVSKNGKWERL